MTEPTSILVVDDNEDLLETFSMILRRRGFEVDTAVDGMAAVDKFKAHRFDVTLMDVVMPVMNGVEAFRKMKEIDPKARVILMTAYSEEELVAMALKEGAHCVVSKPLRIDRMIEMINEASVLGPILVVDDNVDILQTMTEAMERKGYQVLTAVSGEEAVAIARKRTCPIAFIDVKLPVMNGLDTFLRLKEINPGIMAIMITGYKEEMRKTINEALNASAVTCLYKPFNPLKALDLLNQLGAKPHRAGKRDEREKQYISS